jgi:TPR repeat protein
MYLDGQGVPVDLARFFRHASRAAQLGHTRSRIRLACAYLDGQGTRRNRRLGRKLLEDLEQEGWSRARRELARRLCDGNGMRKDAVLGLNLLQHGARQGDEDSLRDLGTYYHDEEHGPAGYRRAIRYYRRAARLGSVFAMIRLHECLDEGHVGAVRKDARLASAWLRRASAAPYDEEFSSWAWFLRAECLIEGKGVRKDLPRAIRLLKRSARDEQGAAWLTLAELAFEGKGMRRDLRKAREWIGQAKWLGQDTRKLERRMSALA